MKGLSEIVGTVRPATLTVVKALEDVQAQLEQHFGMPGERTPAEQELVDQLALVLILALEADSWRKRARAYLDGYEPAWRDRMDRELADAKVTLLKRMILRTKAIPPRAQPRRFAGPERNHDDVVHPTT